MKKINRAGTVALALLAVWASPAHADTFITVPHPQAVFDSSLGTLYSVCPPGQSGSSCTVIDTQDGTQTLTNKTLTAPVINSSTGVGQWQGLTSTTSTALTSTTTAVPVTGLGATVVGGGTYNCDGRLYVTSAAAGGLQVGLIGTNSMTATSAEYQVALGSTTTPGLSLASTTTFGTALGTTTTVNSAVLTGSVVVNAGGTLSPEVAQNASSASSSVILTGSTFNCLRTN